MSEGEALETLQPSDRMAQVTKRAVAVANPKAGQLKCFSLSYNFTITIITGTISTIEYHTQYGS